MNYKPSRQKVKAIPIPRTENISSRVTKSEFTIIEDNARKADMTLSQYVRNICLEKEVIAIPYAQQVAELLHSTHRQIIELKKISDVSTLSNEVSQLVLLLKQNRQSIEESIEKDL